MRGERAFLEDHALEAALVVFEQFGRAEIARDQDRIVAQARAGRGADLARDDPQQAVREILEIVHPVRQQRVVDLAHAHAGALLDALDRRFGGQAGIDRLVDPAAPAFVIGEHLVGLEHLLDARRRRRIRPGWPSGRCLLAHLVEGEIDPLALGLGILGDHMLDLDPRLVEHRDARAEALDQREAFERVGLGQRARADRSFGIDQPGIVDHLGQHHRHGLQRLDLDFLVAARLDMLDGEHAHRALAPHDRHAREGVELVLARFGAVLEFRMARSPRRG